MTSPFPPLRIGEITEKHQTPTLVDTEKFTGFTSMLQRQSLTRLGDRSGIGAERVEMKFNVDTCIVEELQVQWAVDP